MVFSLVRVRSLFDDESGYESLPPPSVKILDSFALFLFSLLCFFLFLSLLSFFSFCLFFSHQVLVTTTYPQLFNRVTFALPSNQIFTFKVDRLEGSEIPRYTRPE